MSHQSAESSLVMASESVIIWIKCETSQDQPRHQERADPRTLLPICSKPETVNTKLNAMAGRVKFFLAADHTIAWSVEPNGGSLRIGSVAVDGCCRFINHAPSRNPSAQQLDLRQRTNERCQVLLERLGDIVSVHYVLAVKCSRFACDTG